MERPDKLRPRRFIELAIALCSVFAVGCDKDQDQGRSTTNTPLRSTAPAHPSPNHSSTLKSHTSESDRARTKKSASENLAAGISDLPATIETLKLSFPEKKELETAIVDTIQMAFHRGYRCDPAELVEIIEDHLTGDKKGRGYNTVVVELLAAKDRELAATVVESMSLSRWRSREVERLYRHTPISNQNDVATSLNSITQIEIPEDRQRAIDGLEIAIIKALEENILTARSATAAIEQSALRDDERLEMIDRIQ